MPLSFAKYHGLGNDFVIAEAVDFEPAHVARIAKQICDRHRGVGADGLILHHRSTTATEAAARMQIVNADGTEPEMCGNGLRTFAHYLHQHHNFGKTFNIETGAGVLQCNILKTNANTAHVEVQMGAPVLAQNKIPATGFKNDPVLNEALTVTHEGESRTFLISLVSMGNPHCIVQVENMPDDWQRWGQLLMSHPRFPAQINVEFTVFKTPERAEVNVWERGVGPTEACGTGACAVAVAGSLMNKLNSQSVVQLPGGPLSIRWNGLNQTVYMTGPSEAVYSGIYALRPE